MAEPLGLSLQRGRLAILAVANEHMVTAVRDITINQGIDPRDSVLVAGGGAAGLTMAKLAEELGSSSVLDPPNGLRRCRRWAACTAGIVTEFTVSRRTHTGQFRFRGRRRGRWDSLDEQMDEVLRAHADLTRGAQVRDYVVEARYPYQVWELGQFRSPARRLDDVRASEQGFHETHERVFAVSEPGQRVECV